MQFILENYLVIILVGLFFVFALIGYLIDLLRKGNNTDNNQIPNDIKEIQMSKMEEQKNIEPVNEQKNPTDELLNNYDNSNVNAQSINENNVNNPH